VLLLLACVTATAVRLLFVQGEFKPSGYYAECVDLIRKLVLSGMVSLLAPGTVMQSFATALFSLVFMVIHAHTCESVSPVCASIHRPLAVHLRLCGTQCLR
jgi:hypothetical protein